MIGQRIRHELVPRRARVSSITDHSSTYRSVALALDESAPSVPFTPMAVGAHVKIRFTPPDRSTTLTRDYTIRAVRDERVVVLDFVLHGDGPASRWAATATPGAEVEILGPRSSLVLPDDRPRYLCLVDSTALPAAWRWLEEAPPTAEVHVAVEASSPEPPALPVREGATVTLVEGTDGSGLVARLRDWAPRPGDLVWAAGETSSMIAVRQAAAELGVARDDLDIHGYWKRGVAGRDHHAPLED